jgi:hypothetical protein
LHSAEPYSLQHLPGRFGHKNISSVTLPNSFLGGGTWVGAGEGGDITNKK